MASVADRAQLSTIHGEAVIMTVIVAAVIAMATVDDYRRVYGVQERGVVATATIVAVESRRQNTDELVVRFTTREGVEVQARVGPQRWDGSPTIGDSQEVLYDPADPANEVLSRGRGSPTHTFPGRRCDDPAPSPGGGDVAPRTVHTGRPDQEPTTFW
ncbi:DUF3592 domain-containing protein [Streptosporangium lutulentum]